MPGCSQAQHLDFFFFNDTATTEIYTLSLHDALPIWTAALQAVSREPASAERDARLAAIQREVSDLQQNYSALIRDRKSTRLNSSHANISYAVFCLKKKNISTTNARKMGITHV